jgi:GAF domain-containing protein
MTQYPDGLIDSLVALNELLASEEGLAATLERVATIACQAVPGCTCASVTQERPGGPRTVAHCGDRAAQVDQAQYDADAGPCLDAFRRNEVVHLRTVGDGPPEWVEFEQAAAQAGIKSSLAVPLLVGERAIGALNLYSADPDGFGQEQVDLATLFGQQAAVAVANAEIYWRTYALTENLRQALENRDVIGQAKGVLMAQQRITADAAFDRLRRASQTLNRKLADIAAHVVRTGELPTTTDF